MRGLRHSARPQSPAKVSIGRHDRGRKEPVEDIGYGGDAIGFLGLADPPRKRFGNERGGADRAELGRQPGIDGRFASCNHHGDSQPFLTHGATRAAIKKNCPECAVVGNVGAQGFKPRLVAFGIADRQRQLVEVCDLALGDGIEKRLFGFVMTKEGRVMDLGFSTDVTDGDLIERLALEQGQHGFLERFARTQSTGMGRSR